MKNSILDVLRIISFILALGLSVPPIASDVPISYAYYPFGLISSIFFLISMVVKVCQKQEKIYVAVIQIVVFSAFVFLLRERLHYH